MNNPTVSIIIPVYNGEKFLKEAIQSVIKQSYENIELIIVNDGSSDSSEYIINSLKEDIKNRFVNFKYIKQENKGVAAAMNKGIEVSSGKYIVSLAQDDKEEPEMIENLVYVFEPLNDEYCMVCGDAKFIDEQSNDIYIKPSINPLRTEISYEKKEGFFNRFLEFTTFGRNLNLKKEFGSYASLLLGNYIPINAALISRKHLIDVGMFTEGNFIEDWDLWLKLSKKYKLLYVDDIVLKYRWHSNNSSKINRLKILISSIETLLNEYNFARETEYFPFLLHSLSIHLNLLKNELYVISDPKLLQYVNKLSLDNINKSLKILQKIKKQIWIKKEKQNAL